ncbi:shufflon system plasmid conjugative transfer pilus tip adhesin PilV [Xanthomonas euvesicatoria pv. eucalypti]|uniref:shufflon system plasmid conjugative transfer pilus tip adhesin PilV n=3 Tax=Xanthomonas euvesicatoria TaxID=456327 RepID=UPI0026E1D5B8|nr:shufflon system plasmid conjugative transfer pilus tip adhesin PilV [Xanthomonas euvesicatoria]MDO7931591.1 shufflon system plasmid conjugative transfer pilus tip adhesin PilV [Xanthomonas euvesicatoria pv. eucalypti]MDO7935682.1 shufflon system plasmid conjugative transfer pilus tip adhesin PilV [Xanthomonas euvesicatoria pv. eucalypti]MDO7940119.1 shufflon system plasmid conjugative transfer pilus tip adhesin PilV [Xanthomonas euvesicatoria pv. eucalypti]MDO7944528.1 shufflon system plasmi
MKTKQRGFALMELVIALGILAALSIGIIGVMRSQAQSKQVAIAATQLVDFTKATERYVQNEYTTILGSAGTTTPVVITVAQLQASGLLPASYPVANVFGQVPTGRARKASAASLETLVVYTGGIALSQGDLDELAGLAAQQGIAGGYIGASDTTRAVGALGAWSMPLANFGISPGAGRIAANLSYTSEATNDTALHRQAIPGRPDLNRMSTAIDMAGNNLNNAGVVQGTEVLGGNISLGGTRYGGANYPYETLSLPAGQNLRFNIGGAEQAVLSGSGEFTAANRLRATNVSAWDVRADGGLYAGALVDAPRYQGNEYYANGWFRTTGQSGWYSEAYGGGWHMTDTTWIRAYNNKSIYTAGEIRGGAVTAEGRLSASDLKLNRVEAEGAGCGENGLTARGGDGKLLSCTNGVWKGPGGISTQVVMGPLSGCRVSSFATCPAGTTLIGGGHFFYQSCSSKEQYRFTSISRPSGNSWEARVEEANVFAYAICAY